MRRVVVTCAPIVVLALLAHVDCSTTGTPLGDAAPDSPQGAFCNAEATYFGQCDVDGGCNDENLAACTTLYGALNPAAAAAFVTCVQQNQVTCGVDFFTALQSTCIQTALMNATSDPAFATLAGDFCKTCAASSSNCGAGFAQGAGFPAFLLSDEAVMNVDKTCVVTADASVALCTKLFDACEKTAAAAGLPPNACGDGG
jgi:hypothetical protein